MQCVVHRDDWNSLEKMFGGYDWLDLYQKPRLHLSHIAIIIDQLPDLSVSYNESIDHRKSNIDITY